MTEQIGRRSDTTRQQILRAACHQFAHNFYSRVNLDEILADAEVTKGAMYFHFRSKHALASAIVKHRAAEAEESVNELLARKLSGLETLIDISYLIAIDDISDESTRAGLNLVESIGRTDGLQSDVLGAWMAALAVVTRQAVEEGDIAARSDPEDIARLVVSMYMGLRQTSNLAAPEKFLHDLETAWAMTLPGIVKRDRIDYLTEFTKRRTSVAIKRAKPL